MTVGRVHSRATGTAIMVLIEQGKLKLDDTLGKLLPECDNNGKGAITLDQLLRHRSGLIADNPISDYKDGIDKAWEKIATMKPVHPPGTKFEVLQHSTLRAATGNRQDRPLDDRKSERLEELRGPVGLHRRRPGVRPLACRNNQSVFSIR